MADLYESLKGVISGDENVSKVLSTVKNVIDKHGLDAVLEKFRASGLDEKVQSWISQGKNIALRPGEVVDALGSELDSFAADAGVAKDQAADGSRSASRARRQAHPGRGGSERGQGQERAQLDPFVARSEAAPEGWRSPSGAAS